MQYILTAIRATLLQEYAPLTKMEFTSEQACIHQWFPNFCVKFEPLKKFARAAGWWQRNCNVQTTAGESGAFKNSPLPAADSWVCGEPCKATCRAPSTAKHWKNAIPTHFWFRDCNLEVICDCIFFQCFEAQGALQKSPMWLPSQWSQQTRVS